MDFTKLAFVDVETTGLSPSFDRVIDVGVVVVGNGGVAETWESLVNPNRYVSPFIQSYTGIDVNELEYAPSFRQLSDELWMKLEGAVMVAHNARFDYGFLYEEFRRAKMNFKSSYFCSAQLSRRLFPGYRGHGLDKVIERFGIKVKRRHRALDDALAVWEFFRMVESNVSEEVMENLMRN
jgi:DNA polymerase-3 subunit epsilon